MKIGVISDTHSKSLPEAILCAFRKVDLIIHAGDFCSENILEELGSMAPVEAVHGNMDNSILRCRLPKRKVIECEGIRIGIFHGEGAPSGLLKRVEAEFKTENVNAIVFGHSHQPMNSNIKGILFFNPGSPTDKIFAPYQSYGILDIQNRIIKGTIVKIL